MGERRTVGTCQLPVYRIKTIMKSSPDVSSIGQESLFLITKATELFVQDLAQMALQTSSDKQNVDYNDLAEIIDNQEMLQFLKDIIPKKIKYRDYLDMVERGEVE